MSATNLARDDLEYLLRTAGIAERRAGGRGSVFSEPVLLAVKTPPAEEIFDQDGRLLGTFRAGSDNPPFLRRALLSTGVSELVDERDRVLLTVRQQGRIFDAVGVDGSDAGRIWTRRGWRPSHSIEFGGEIIGSFRFAGTQRYRVLTADEAEVGRISHHRFGLQCNVIEMDDAMPEALRRLMPVASKGVFDLKANKT